MKNQFSISFVALSMALMVTPVLTQTEPDLILTQARVWTGNPSLPWAEAVAIAGNRILAVGSSGNVLQLRGKTAQILELPGCLILPGFIDNHTHFLEGGFQKLGVNLREAKNPKDFAERIRKKALSLPPGHWITGGRWDHESWPDAKLPTKELIDSLTPNTPVLVSRLDGHMALANTLALRKAGINRKTAAPPGGVIVRNPQTGEPTGILKDSAMGLVEEVIPPPSPSESTAALLEAIKEAALNGVTSIQDIAAWKDLEIYRQAQQSGQLTTRIYARMPLADWRRLAEKVNRSGVGDDWIKLGGLKAFMDGSLGSSTAYFFEPYQDEPSTSGLLAEEAIPQSKIQQRMREADLAGLQLSVHAIGDQANHILLGLFEDLARTNGTRDRRCRIEHAQHLKKEDIPSFARIGVIASAQPVHLIDDGRWADKRLGKDRARGSYAFRSLLDAGARVCFGTDWPVAPLNPLLGLYAAVTRQTTDGAHPQGWIPEEKITLEEAVQCYTVNSAFAAFEEDRKGRLEAGFLADLVVLDRNLFIVSPEEIPRARVLYTIVDGRVVYRH